LLQRLQHTGEQAAWVRLVDLYSPHLFLWACRAGLPGADAAELVRRVFATVARKLPEFRLGAPGGFRQWLRGLAHEQRGEILRERKTPASGVEANPDVVSPEADGLWGDEYLPLLLRSAIELYRMDFPPPEWQAFQALTLEGRPADVTAQALSMPAATVYAADSRVLQRLRQELDGLLDGG
jgi:RNA polymerase sigma-70 factor (ECF subfamily)